jgi:hypothetical protein
VLPAALAHSQTAALQAAAESTRMKTNLKDAERARQSAASRSEVIRLDVLLTQARTKLHEAQTRADFAHLVLGRECLGADFRPPDMEHEIQEIQRLQQHLKA